MYNNNGQSLMHIERYQDKFMAKGHELIGCYDKKLKSETDAAIRMEIKKEANKAIAAEAKAAATAVLNKVLYELSNQMKNGYSRSDN